MSEIKLTADSGGGSTSLKGPASSGVDTAFVLPSADGSTGQFIKTDGSKNLSFASVSSTPEGTAILSTGESGGTKFLREDGDGTCSWQTAAGGKLLQHKHTKTYYSTYTAWPTSETDITDHSIAMTKQSSGSSKYIFRVNFQIRYAAGSINAWVKIFKGDNCIDSDMDSNYGLGYLHSPTSSMNHNYSQMWIDDAATDTYKLRYITGSTNFQFHEKTWLWFEIMEVDV